MTEAVPSHRATLGRRLQIAVFTPVLLLLIVALVLGAQLLRMIDHAENAAASSELVAKLYDVQREIIDQETALRGFLITRDRGFLEPYERARVTESLRELAVLVEGDAAQRERHAVLEARYERWLRGAATALSGDLDVSVSPALMRERKRRMDDVRATVSAMLDVERSRLRERSAMAIASRSATMYLFVGLFAVVALTLSFLSRKQLDEIAATYQAALEGEQDARQKIEAESWVRAGIARVAEQVMGEITREEVARRSLDALADYVGADVGAFFAAVDDGFEMLAGYGLASATSKRFGAGEGLVGRAAATKGVLHLRDVPEDYLRVESGTGARAPVELLLVPAIVGGTVRAVLELGFLRPVAARELELVGRLGESVAIAVRSALQVARLRDLLEESQRQAEELQTQQEELRVTNEELEERGRTLREAQAMLEERQEELLASNARLEEHAESLDAARHEVAKKAEEIARASQYKSEFLANMSHELRTPLNSSLILARLLADNKSGNLTPEQVKFAETIHAAGTDLLGLINDVLDIAKIEAGKTEIALSTVRVDDVVGALERLFEPLVHDKGLALEVTIDPSAPASLETDRGKLDQILKNLLSNALKFTDAGRIALEVSATHGRVRFCVTDTGIGIAEAQHEAVFEAFRQVDGASNRRYGGTGLGLAISRDLARLLGGDVTLRSALGEGSVFTLELPIRPSKTAAARDVGAQVVERHAPRTSLTARPSGADVDTLHPASIPDDRGALDRARRILLVIEDDVAFAAIVVDLARELGFQCIVTHTADGGVALARKYQPSAIVLDMYLPDHSGLSVIERLKRDPATRHIPIHGVSVSDLAQSALAMGAVGYVRKPAKREELLSLFGTLEDRLDRALRRILVVEDDPVQRESIERLLGAPDVEIVAVGTTEDALRALGASTFDCVVTDLVLPDASGFDLLERIDAESRTSSFPPIIVYTGRSLDAKDEARLLRHSRSIIVKDARSPERLLDEVMLFLHRVESELPSEQRTLLQRARDRDALFEGRAILVVEDDVRNIFALSSILEPKGAKVIVARNGREALEALEREGEVALVLMDIMMPEMDGFEAMRRIRANTAWAKLPIIALTAKAMKDDQERCLAAGANDYISKPFDVDVLVSLLRVWLPR